MANSNDDLQKAKQLLQELNSLRRKMDKEPLRLTDDEAVKQLKSLPGDIEQARRSLSDMLGTASSLYAEIMGVSSAILNTDENTRKANKAFRDLAKDAEKLKFDEQEISKLSAKELSNLKERVKQNSERVKNSVQELDNFASLEKEMNRIVKHGELLDRSEDQINDRILERLKNNKDLTDIQKEMAALYFTQGNSLDRINDAVDERLNKEIKVNEQIKGFTAMADLVNSIPGLRKFSSAFQDAQKAAKKVADEGGTLAESNAAGFAKLKESVKDLFTSPLGQLTLLAGLFKSVLNIALEVDKEVNEIGKAQGISADEARRFRQEVWSSAKASENLTFTTKNLLQSYSELSKAAGVTRGFTEAELKAQTTLTKNVGIQAETAAKLANLSRVNGETSEDALKSIVSQTTQLKLQEGLQLDNRDVINEVANIQGQLAANYKNSPGLIAKAVVEVRKLGLSLEQAANASKKLLDFQSSIELELEAELLTGKELNLERARALALQGDSAGAAAELAKNFGSLADFQNLNVIAQDALAASMGMSSDELANILQQQENLNRLGEETRNQINARVEALKAEGDIAGANKLLSQAANEEQALAAMKRLDAQEKFNAAVEKAKDIIGFLGNNLWLVGGILGSIATTMGYIATKAIITALALDPTAALRLLGGIALVGAVVGGIGGGLVGAFTGPDDSPTSMQDGAIDSDGGVLVSGPKGSIQLDKDDSIIAGTNLFDSKNKNSDSGNAELLRTMIAKLDKLTKVVEKGGNVYMDGNKVGQALVLSSYQSS